MRYRRPSLRLPVVVAALCCLHIILRAGWLSAAVPSPLSAHPSWTLVELKLHLQQQQLEHEQQRMQRQQEEEASPTTTTTSISTEEPADLSSLDVAACWPHEAVMWNEWRACIMQSLPTTASIEAFIATQAHRLPWSLQSDTTAVLLEFRPLASQMHFTVDNAKANLPVQWRIQIVGGPAVCRLAQQLFPVDVAAGKIVTTDSGLGDNMQQTRISRVFTDLDLLYNRLLGDTWLFMQYDAAICSPQRHKLQGFLRAGYGWWGAPWA